MALGRKGAYSDLFIFLIMSFILVVVSGIFIFIANTMESNLYTTMGTLDISNSVDVNKTIENTMGQVALSLESLYWISTVLMVGMILSIFIGSYLVTTKPIFFIPYIFIVVIAVVIAVVVSNAYETIASTPELASTFAGFVGANFILSKFPLWVTIIGFIGGIIMFSRLGSKEEQMYYG